MLLSAATPQGNLPCIMTGNDAWVDRTQTPIISFIVWQIYLRTGSRSFIDMAYDALARNNEWIRTARDGNGNGLAGRSVGAHIGTRSFYGVTDATGVVDIERRFEVLGVPTQHVVTWKFNGADIYAASTASNKLTVIKSDCQMTVRSRFYNGMQVTDAGWRRRTGANEWSASDQDVEITNNGASIGTYNTNDSGGLESTPIATAATLATSPIRRRARWRWGATS